MSITIVRGTNKKPAASRALAELLAHRGDLSGELFIGYPIIRTANGGYPIDALLISSETGIVAFDLIEGSALDEDYPTRQDDFANKLEAYLKSHAELVDRRDLLIPIHTISYAPGLSTSGIAGDEYPRANDTTLVDRLRRFRWENRSPVVYSSALSVIQSTSTIRKNRTRREVEREGSRGARLKRLEDQIATLDPVQSKAVIETIDGVQRIRGLAGSGASLPSPEEIFDAPGNGASTADGTDNDLILETCYRNSRPLLVTAHALGFGVYRKPEDQSGLGLVQMFDHPRLWQDIGYRPKAGELRPGASVTLLRPERTSPRFLEDHSEIDDLIQFKCFESPGAQADWLIDEIKRNIEVEELRHDDIIVVNPDPLTTRQKVGPIRAKLLEAGIDSHVAGVDTEADTFFRTGERSVTFTGIFRAKGNEAGMVYVINAQDCHAAARNLATIRNRLFTAITRSKAWIRVLGVGQDMARLIDEYQALKSRGFELHFTYPTKEQRERLRIIHRDRSAQEERRLRDRESMVRDLVRDLESGTANIQDFDPALISELKKHVGSAD